MKSIYGKLKVGQQLRLSSICKRAQALGIPLYMATDRQGLFLELNKGKYTGRESNQELCWVTHLQLGIIYISFTKPLLK